MVFYLPGCWHCGRAACDAVFLRIVPLLYCSASYWCTWEGSRGCPSFVSIPTLWFPWDSPVLGLACLRPGHIWSDLPDERSLPCCWVSCLSSFYFLFPHLHSCSKQSAERVLLQLTASHLMLNFRMRFRIYVTSHIFYSVIFKSDFKHPLISFYLKGREKQTNADKSPKH